MAVDLANTAMVVRNGQTVDLLATPADLKQWLQAERSRLGDCDFALAHLREFRALRDAARSVLLSIAEGAPVADDALRQINAASALAPAVAQLHRGDDGRLQARELIVGGEPMAQLLAKLARSVTELVAGLDGDRLHLCTAPSCGMVFLGARRWCCAACGNRARAARHYARSKGRVSPRAA